jgi:hypothetical protein
MPVVKFVNQEHGSDCSIAALAMALGISYPEALLLVAKGKPNVLTAGATWPDLKKAAKRHGTPMVLAKFNPDDEDATGILAVELIDNGKRVEHALFVKWGLIFDGDSGAVWEIDAYLKAYNADVLRFSLVRKRSNPD